MCIIIIIIISIIYRHESEKGKKTRLYKVTFDRYLPVKATKHTCGGVHESAG